MVEPHPDLRDEDPAAAWNCDPSLADHSPPARRQIWLANQASRKFRASPFVWRDATKIPPREWLYGHLLIRKFVSLTVAPGGVGKTSLITTEALAMATGRPLLGVKPPRPLGVWLWNLEDPQEETERKIVATAQHFGISASDVGGRLFVDSGRQTPLVIATMTKAGTEILRPLIDDLVAEIKERRIDVLKIDPFVSSHKVPENDNGAQDEVIKEWGRVADRANCAVHLIDHTRKQGLAETEITAESARGAKAKIDAGRVVRVVNRMTKQEAEQAGVDNHRLYFRTFNDKANLAPPVEHSDWFALKSVDLGNGPPSDHVGVVTRWEWPDALADVTGADFDQVATIIRAGAWRENAQAAAWVGKAVAEALDLDVSNKADKAKITRLLKVWRSTGALIVVDRDDEQRRPRKFVEVAADA